jgi:endonuclease III
MSKPAVFQETVRKLESAYGPPARPAVRDPYEIALLENVAYLVDDARRMAAFRKLKSKISLRPEAILAAPERLLVDAIRDGGMLPEHRARKVRRCAEIAAEIGLARLRKAVREDPKAARALLKRFPGIGEPGADKILLYAGGHRYLGPDSNALRVLCRLGFGREEKDYARTYRSVRDAVEPELPARAAAIVRARELLRRHGQEICKSSVPRCEVCTLRPACPYGLRTRD